MALNGRFIGSIVAFLIVGLAFGCGPKPEAKGPKKKASDGLDLGFMDEGSSASSSDGDSGEEAEGYKPCAKKSCGDACTLCDPLDDSCVEVMVLHQCSAKGACVIAPIKCGG